MESIEIRNERKREFLNHLEDRGWEKRHEGTKVIYSDKTTVPQHVTTEPQIFITVQRYINGQQVHTIREFSLMTYLRAKYPGLLVESEIDAMLKEVHYDR